MSNKNNPNDSGADELYELKNLFYVGSYQACINEGSHLTNLKNPQLTIERDFYVYRSYIAKGEYTTVLDEISSSSSPPLLQSVRFLAQYLNSTSSSEKDSIIQSSSSLLQSSPNQPLILLSLAILYSNHDPSFEKSLSTLFSSPSSLSNPECLSLIIHLYLLISRPDHAHSSFLKLQSIDPDSPLTLLSSLSLSLFQPSNTNTNSNSNNSNSSGNLEERLEEGMGIIGDMMGRSGGGNSMLLNGIAVCLLMKGDMKNGEKEVNKSLEKDASKEETLISSIVLNIHSGKTFGIQVGAAGAGGIEALVGRNWKKIKGNNEASGWVKGIEAKEAKFDSLADSILSSANIVPS